MEDKKPILKIYEAENGYLISMGQDTYVSVTSKDMQKTITDLLSKRERQKILDLDKDKHILYDILKDDD